MRRLGSKAKLAQYFQENIGKVLSSKELQEVAGGVVEWGRRIRELRQAGWSIETHNDRADLTPGEYILVSPPPPGIDHYKISRPISNKLRAQVLERNGYTCQMCGAGAGDPVEDYPDRKVRLHIGHIIDKSHGGKDKMANLRAICSQCNEGAKNIAQEPPSWTWLIAQVRRAKIDDQKAVLEWLQRKYSPDSG